MKHIVCLFGCQFYLLNEFLSLVVKMGASEATVVLLMEKASAFGLMFLSFVMSNSSILRV